MPICFPPVVDERTVFMVIGSMPGAASLAAQAYYAHKRNLFWPCVSAAFSPENPPQNYADKLAVLLANGGGLWDALSSCERAGSLDTHIRQAVPNDFHALFARYPAIKTLLFNGTAATNTLCARLGSYPAKHICYCRPPAPPMPPFPPNKKARCGSARYAKHHKGAINGT